jgi:deoxycytidylate deaminase
MATAVLMASRSNCERLHVGCVIVTGGARKNRLVAAGYNGYLPGTPHLSRLRDGHEQATVHAEQNAVADAASPRKDVNTVAFVGRSGAPRTVVVERVPSRRLAAGKGIASKGFAGKGFDR